jgi:hypothetical protein
MGTVHVANVRAVENMETERQFLMWTNYWFSSVSDGSLYINVVGYRGWKWSWHIWDTIPAFAYYASHSTFDKERKPDAVCLDIAQNMFKLDTLLYVHLIPQIWSLCQLTFPDWGFIAGEFWL